LNKNVLNAKFKPIMFSEAQRLMRFCQQATRESKTQWRSPWPKAIRYLSIISIFIFTVWYEL